MGGLKIRNVTRGTYLADHAVRATTIWQRGIGLMGRADVPEGYGLVIDPCRSIHMFFMRTAIDVCHVDAMHRIVRILDRIKPWCVGPIVWRSRYVIELPPGTASRTGTRVGDQLALDAEDG